MEKELAELKLCKDTDADPMVEALVPQLQEMIRTLQAELEQTKTAGAAELEAMKSAQTSSGEAATKTKDTLKEEAKKQISHITAEMKQLEEELHGMKTAGVEMQAEHESVLTEFRATSSELEKARVELVSLKDSASGESANFAEAQGKVAELESKLGELEQQLADAVAKADAAEAEHASALQVLQDVVDASQET